MLLRSRERLNPKVIKIIWTKCNRQGAQMHSNLTESRFPIRFLGVQRVHLPSSNEKRPIIIPIWIKRTHIKRNDVEIDLKQVRKGSKSPHCQMNERLANAHRSQQKNEKCCRTKRRLPPAVLNGQTHTHTKRKHLECICPAKSVRVLQVKLMGEKNKRPQEKIPQNHFKGNHFLFKMDVQVWLTRTFSLCNR